MTLPGTPPSHPDRWARFDALLPTLEGPVLALVDAQVLSLHPSVGRALRRHGAQVVRLKAGEATKSLATVHRVGEAALALPRDCTVLAIGGGTIGDVAAVYAHLHKRGARLVQVPTTLLAAVDSSVGGKGAVNVGPAKNALGVFHFAAEGWLCAELFSTLSEAQRREGRLEAWKMTVALDEAGWHRWRQAAPDDGALVRRARALKEAVVRDDPFEQRGQRVVLNFGHTFGHAIEGLTNFRVRHGEAVGLGLLCALDVGRRLGVTSEGVAREVEASLPNGEAPRRRLARVFSRAGWSAVAQLLRVDKKGEGQLVLLRKPGRWVVQAVPAPLLRDCVKAWGRGAW